MLELHTQMKGSILNLKKLRRLLTALIPVHMHSMLLNVLYSEFIYGHQIVSQALFQNFKTKIQFLKPIAIESEPQSNLYKDHLFQKHENSFQYLNLKKQWCAKVLSIIRAQFNLTQRTSQYAEILIKVYEYFIRYIKDSNFAGFNYENLYKNLQSFVAQWKEFAFQNDEKQRELNQYYNKQEKQLQLMHNQAVQNKLQPKIKEKKSKEQLQREEKQQLRLNKKNRKDKKKQNKNNPMVGLLQKSQISQGDIKLPFLNKDKKKLVIDDLPKDDIEQNNSADNQMRDEEEYGSQEQEQ